MLQKEQVKKNLFVEELKGAFDHLVLSLFLSLPARGNQLRALQGQKRALLALKRRSEQRLIEQQQLIQKQTVDAEEIPPENDLLLDINTLRDR